MKNQFYTFVSAIIMTFMLQMATNSANAQGNPWKLGGNNNVGTNDFIGPTNNADFKIISNNLLRINVGKDGTTNFYGKVKMTVDSLNVKGFIKTDSMRITGSLHIGDSSLWIGGTPLGGNTDAIQTNHSSITFGRIVNFPQVRIGIGITPIYKLQLFDQSFSVPNGPAPAVYESFINKGTGIYSGTGTTATDGFLVGIETDGTVDLKQQEDKDMLFYTGAGSLNAIRMTIKGQTGTTQGFVGINTTTPANALDVHGQCNIHTVIQDDKLMEVLVRDPAQDGLIRWRDASTLGGSITADNGLHMQTLTQVDLGGNLSYDTQIQMLGNRLYFPGQAYYYSNTSLKDAVGIGYNIYDPLPGKLSVNENGVGNSGTIAISAINGSPPTVWASYGVQGIAHGTSTIPTCPHYNVGVYGSASNSSCQNRGVEGNANNLTNGANTGGFFLAAGSSTQNRAVYCWAQGINSPARGGEFHAQGSTNDATSCYGIEVYAGDPFIYSTSVSQSGYFSAYNGASSTIGINVIANGNFNNNPLYPTPNNVYGGRFYSFNGINTKGIYATANNGVITPNTLAAHFWGDAYMQGSTYGSGVINYNSDSIIKDNVTDIVNSLQIISALTPHKFTFKRTEYPYLNMPDGEQYGLIAQEVERIIPDLVHDVKVPNNIDTAGNVTDYNLILKTLNYNGFIPILIQGVKELDSIVTGITSPPSKPILLSPSNEAVDVSPSATFFWHKQNNVNYYRIIFSTTPDSSGINQIYDVTDTMATGAFECGATYYWWIIAYNTYGHSEASDIWSFTTAFPPSAPVLASPVNGDTITENSIILSWHPAEGASVYVVNIQAIPGAHQQAVPIYPLQFVTDTFLYFEVIPFLNYSWSVSACIEARVCCNISETWHFSTMEGFDIIKAQSVAELSDSQLKTNVAPLSGSLSKIEQLNGISFEWDSLQYPGAVFEQGKQIGLIAQDVQPIIPEVVKTDAQGYSYIEYNRLIPVLIESIKEQQSTIDSMKLQIQSLLGTNQKSTGNNENSENQSKMQYVELASVNAIILNQNDPNPFAEETDITYYIPDNISEAKLMFYDNSGKIIKTVELIGKGNGTLHVYASNLSSGIYTYALVADGKVIDTKKMMKSK